MNDNSLRELCEMSANRLFEQADIAHYTPKERQDYEDSLKVYRDLKNVLDTAELKGLKRGLSQGREEGLSQGREEGRKEGLMNVAKSLKTMGMTVEQIIKATGLTEEEILKL